MGDTKKAAGCNSSAEVASKPVLSPREQEVLMAAWISIKDSEPQINYDRLANILGLKNAHTASTIFSNVRKKLKQYRSLLGDDDGQQSSNATPRATPKSTPRKRAGGQPPSTPKSGKGTKRMRTEEASPAKDGPSSEENGGSIKTEDVIDAFRQVAQGEV